MKTATKLMLVLALLLGNLSNLLADVGSDDRKIQAARNVASHHFAQPFRIHPGSKKIRMSVWEPIGSFFDLLLPGEFDRDVVSFRITDGNGAVQDVEVKITTGTESRHRAADFLTLSPFRKKRVTFERYRDPETGERLISSEEGVYQEYVSGAKFDSKKGNPPELYKAGNRNSVNGAR